MLWNRTVQAGVKGIIHVPAHNTPMMPSRRDALLMAIAKARNWADELAHGRLGSFAGLAGREGKVERHVRLLVPLAFVSPRIISGLLDGTAPAGLTIAALARALPWSWAEQERRLGLTAIDGCPCRQQRRHCALDVSFERRGACADRRLTLLAPSAPPASAARPPRGFGGGGVLLRRPP